MSEKIAQSPNRPIAKSVFAVILVGGKGKRLRPLSTAARPKAFLSITADRRTLFRNTMRRIGALVGPSNILVVANRKHGHFVKKDMPGIKAENLILEPVCRNTAPAIALAARLLLLKGRADVIVVLPTDHYIRDESGYRLALSRGIKIAAENEAPFVVLGIEPKFPATQFGYIRLKAPSVCKAGVYKVDRFIEKPGLRSARRYIKNGRYLWNSGAFIFRVDALMDAIRHFAPQIYRLIEDPRRITRLYAKMPDVSIDYAIMQKVKDIYCVKVSHGWSDVGSFQSLKEVLKLEKRRFVEKGGKVVKIL